jgi:putative spermidine/putrescine transport system ATP-binding protein
MSMNSGGMAAGDLLVRFVDVEKTYDGATLVVRRLNLDIRAGEFLTLLGPSGSGKTTCLMMLAGFEAPTAGEIYLKQRPLSRIPPHKRGIGMVFQNYALFPHLTVGENIAYPLRVRGIARKQAECRVAAALQMVRLAGLQNRRPAHLSGGQQQRVALARALVFNPELILMDEPLGALDKHLREQMQLEIKQLHSEIDVTVVYVTHDQAEALTMSDRIAVFHDGLVQQLAEPDQLYDKPDNLFVATFIGDSNVLEGFVRQVEGKRAEVMLQYGDLVSAQVVDGIEHDGAAVLSIRPERVELMPPGAAGRGGVAGRVEERLFLGDQIRLRLNVFGRSDFFVKLSSSSQFRAADVGDEVMVGWDWQDCRLFRPPNRI